MRSHRIAGALAGLAVALAACSSPNVSRAKFETELYRNLKPKGFSRAQVACMTNKTFASLDQSQINQLYKAEQEDQLAQPVRERFDSITRACTPQTS